MTFQKQLSELRERALAKINSLNEKHELPYEEGEDSYYDLPVVPYITKHDYYEEYAIVGFTKDTVYGIGRTEGIQGDTEEFSFDDLDTPLICYLADLL